MGLICAAKNIHNGYGLLPNMNVAVLISGRVRMFDIAWPLLHTHIFEGRDIDVFLSHNAMIPDDLDGFCAMYPVKSMQTLLPPIPDAWEEFPRRKETIARRVASMYYNIENAYRLMKEYATKHSIVYDVVLYMRADMMTTVRLDFVLPLTPGVVYIPNDYDWAGGLNDQMAYGDMDAMALYCSTFFHIPDYCTKDNIVFHPETILRHHIEKRGLILKRFEFPYELHKERHIDRKD